MAFRLLVTQGHFKQNPGVIFLQLTGIIYILQLFFTCPQWYRCEHNPFRASLQGRQSCQEEVTVYGFHDSFSYHCLLYLPQGDIKKVILIHHTVIIYWSCYGTRGPFYTDVSSCFCLLSSLPFHGCVLTVNTLLHSSLFLPPAFWMILNYHKVCSVSHSEFTTCFICFLQE